MSQKRHTFYKFGFLFAGFYKFVFVFAMARNYSKNQRKWMLKQHRKLENAEHELENV